MFFADPWFLVAVLPAVLSAYFLTMLAATGVFIWRPVAVVIQAMRTTTETRHHET